MPPKGWRKYPDEARRQAAKAAEIDANGVSLEDITLPRSTVLRLAKRSLPENGQIQKEALIAITKSATVFVSFLGSHASDVAKSSNRRYIAPKDVLEALDIIELGSLTGPLVEMLESYNKANASKLAAKKEAAAAVSASRSDAKNDDVTEDEEDIEEEEEEEDDDDDGDENEEGGDSMTDDLVEGHPRKKTAGDQPLSEQGSEETTTAPDTDDHPILATKHVDDESPEDTLRVRQQDDDDDDDDDEVTDSE